MQRAGALVRSSYHLTKQTKKLLSSNSAFLCSPVWVKVVLEPALNSSKAIRSNSSLRTDHPLASRPKRTVRRPRTRWRQMSLNYRWQRQLLWETSRNIFLLKKRSQSSLWMYCVMMHHAWTFGQGCHWWRDSKKYSKFDMLFSPLPVPSKGGSRSLFSIACQIGCFKKK